MRRRLRDYWPISAITLGGAGLIACGLLLGLNSPTGGLSIALHVLLSASAATIGAGGAALTIRRSWRSPADTAERDLFSIADASLDPQQLREQLLFEWTQQQAALMRREESLAARLHKHHQWLEMPLPEQDTESQPTLQKLEELTQRDRQLFELLDRESQRIYADIQRNRYMVDGQLQVALIRDESLRLIENVARLYMVEDVESPLLEISTSALLRALSRGSLQLLVVMDGLPLSVKDQSFKSLYNYVRHAVRAYGAYKSAEPYLSYANTAFYVGRFAMGANPLTLGAWWAATKLGKRGATSLTNQWIDRQALKLLSDLIRVIAFEAANIFGGDFRHRDANWIFAAELTEMLSALPASRETLSQALQLVGSLELRSEYDRVFLYRCLAERRSAKPSRFRAAAVLDGEQRQKVAQNLEKFFHAFVHVATSKLSTRWKQGAEERLDVKLDLAGSKPLNVSTQRESATRSLIGFLVEAKQLEVPDAVACAKHAPWLTSSAADLSSAPESDSVDALTASARQLLDRIGEDPPFFFEQPDLDVGSTLASQFIEELVRYEVTVPPSIHGDLVVQSALYLRWDRKRIVDLLARRKLSQVRTVLPPTRSRLSSALAADVLAVIEPGEQLQFIYDQATIAVAGSSVVETSDEATKSRGAVDTTDRPHADADVCLPAECVLLGTTSRLVLVARRPQLTLLWLADHTTELATSPGLMRSDAVVRGGVWLLPGSHESREIRLAGDSWKKAEATFGPLDVWLTNMRLSRPS